ncbi:unnamed protein product [Staurois parvus]|uniref:Uncharacterized protein n=1 Tax=Staurois parvus TaxID=386267 RepID=A0ABN9H8F2_9NEOB|nr:unnamed protein product [Staurois parvus]
MVGVTSQGSGAGEMVRQSQGSEQGQQRIRQEQGTGSRNRIQGPGETTHQDRVCRSGHLLNTPV